MPCGDGTGPRGLGMGTGRGLGFCGTGFRRGFGRGMGFVGYGRRFAIMPVQQARNTDKQYLEQELKMIEQQEQVLQTEKENIKRMIKEQNDRD